jgi:hypothetical protein
MALGTAASGPGGHFLRLINSGDLNKYKFNQKTRSIHLPKLVSKHKVVPKFHFMQKFSALAFVDMI